MWKRQIVLMDAIAGHKRIKTGTIIYGRNSYPKYGKNAKIAQMFVVLYCCSSRVRALLRVKGDA